MFNCPKCGKDMFPLYDSIIGGYKKQSKYCKITNYHSEYSLDALNAHSWDIEFVCPKCKTKWTGWDSDN